MYELFTFEHVHNLHLQILTMLKDFFVSYLLLESIVMYENSEASERQPLLRITKAVLHESNWLILTIKMTMRV